VSASDAALRAGVARHATLIRETIAYVHGHPELPHEEHACAAHLCEVLEGLGFHVERGIAGMATGFRATLAGSRPGRAVGLVALYDAVAAVPPQGGLVAVHSCGHGPIAGGVMGAAAALAETRDELPGRVVVMGCPADEIHAPKTVARGGGKALTAAAGAWDGIDAALYAHPEYIDTVSQASLWMRRLVARVAGTRSLAEGASQPPLEAAVAAVEALRSLPAGRAILERLELDGDVEEGGGLVAQLTFLVWADDEAGLDELAERLREGIRAGGADAERATADAEWSTGTTIPAIVPNDAVTAAVAEAVRASGRPFVEDPPTLPFATDFGAISRRVPSALIGIGRPGGWAFHTPLGEQEFASEDGVTAALAMAEVLALAVRRLVEPA
jgi:metal-dependent amidase/aminoacylase/carboxypeptidase family protein